MNSITLPPEVLRATAGSAAHTGSKHELLSQAILSAIMKGRWQPGDRLPTEASLAASLPFSLGTIQRALRSLVDGGILVRRHKSGTFVAPTRQPMQDPWHCRFLDDAGGYLPIFATVLKRETRRDAPAFLTDAADAASGAIVIDRVIDVGGEFSVFSRFYVDAKRFASLLKRPIAELDGANFKAILAREYKLPVLHFSHMLSSAPLPPEIARALKVSGKTSSILLEVSAFDPRGTPVYFQEIHIPPNQRRLVISEAPTRHG
jgi:GntR family transcriptional regulator